MTIKIAETPVSAIITALKARLGTELTTIETERGDGISLPAPAATDYFNRPKGELAGKGPFVEVFEDAFDMSQDYSDIEANRLTFVASITVRITLVNGNPWKSAEDMSTAMRRYGAAVGRVFVRYPQLENAETTVQAINPVNYEPHWIVEDENSDKVTKITLAIKSEVRCEEVLT